MPLASATLQAESAYLVALARPPVQFAGFYNFLEGLTNCRVRRETVEL